MAPKTATATTHNANKKSRSPKPKRVILFPTEPSTIGNDKIDAAIDAVLAEKKRRLKK